MGLTRFVDSGGIEPNSGIVERGLKSQAVTRESALSPGRPESASNREKGAGHGDVHGDPSQRPSLPWHPTDANGSASGLRLRRNGVGIVELFVAHLACLIEVSTQF